MTNTQMVAVGIRLFCIWLFVHVLRNSLAMGWWIIKEADDNATVLAAFLAANVIAVLLIIVLWRSPMSAARMILPKETQAGTVSQVAAEHLQQVGFCLLGLWLLTVTGPYLISQAILIAVSDRFDAAYGQHGFYAMLVEVALEFLLAIWLLFGARGLLGLLAWARTAGASPRYVDSTDADSSQAPDDNQPLEPR